MWTGLIQSMEGLNRTKTWRKIGFVPPLIWVISLLLPSAFQVLIPFNYHKLCWDPNCRQQMVGILSLHKPVCQYPIINHMLVLFLWRTPIHKGYVQVYQLIIYAANGKTKLKTQWECIGSFIYKVQGLTSSQAAPVVGSKVAAVSLQSRGKVLAPSGAAL